MDNSFKQENLLPRLTFNPGLALTGFRTTRPQGVERHCESKVTCLRAQHYVPGQSSNPDRSTQRQAL